MDHETFTKQASPPCHDCAAPVQRVEIPWFLNGEGDWVPGTAVMVCVNGCRVVVELF